MKRLFTTLAFVVSTYCIFASNIQIDGIWYNLYISNQTAEVTFKGADRDSYTGEYIGSVVIPETVIYDEVEYTVTTINDAFWNCRDLTSITIPNSITLITGNAFWNCAYLENVYINDLTAWLSLLSTGSDCNPLCVANYVSSKLYLNGELVTDLSIPEGISIVRSEALRGCGSIISLTIPDGVTKIEWGAFYGCKNMVSATIGKNVTSIAQGIFFDCDNLTSIVIDPDNSTYDSRFDCNAIIETATSTLLSGCKNSTIPGNVTKIDDCAFMYCHGLTSLKIPSSVTYIGESAFGECDHMQSIKCAALTPPELGGYAFDNVSKTIPVYVPTESLDIYKNADQWEKFTNYHGYTPEPCSLDKGECGLNLTWRYSCDSVLVIEGEGEMTNWSSENDVPWYQYRHRILSVSLSDAVTSIGDFAFYGSDEIKSLDIPDNIIVIGNQAFRYCTNISTVTIGSGLTSLGNWAFNGCHQLTAFHVSNTNPYFCDVNGVLFNKEMSTLVQYPTALASARYEIPEGVATIASAAFAYCKNLSSLVIPASVSAIEWYALFSCSNLLSLTCLATTPPAVGQFAFWNNAHTIPLYIPAESVELYRNDEEWQYFTNVIALQNSFVVNYEDKDESPVFTETITLHVPEPPIFVGFTFLKWIVKASDLSDGITIQAIYSYDGDPTSAPSVVTNPANPAQKLVRDGNIYILTGDRTYTLTGQLVE